MKIDFSTIFLVIFLVLPGLFSRRSQNAISLRSLETQGSTEELADFVLQGTAVHLILVLVAALVLAFSGLALHWQFGFFFSLLDQADLESWVKVHHAETVLLFAAYVLCTFVVGYFFGLLCGVWRLRRPLTSYLLGKATWLQKLGVTGSLGEPPIVYQVLSPRFAEDGTPLIIFVEAEMKGGLGFYSGQVRQYAVVKDGEAHKQVYLVEVWYRLTRSDQYEEVETDGVLIDLADVAALRIDQKSEASLVAEDGSELVADSGAVVDDQEDVG